MDARPHRPRDENARPALGHRHKSTGNMALAAANPPTASMRGPAKRATFEDVTNMSKQHAGGRDVAKIHKAQSVCHLSHARPPTNFGKENVVLQGKDSLALARPARKTRALVNNNPVARESRSTQQETRVEKIPRESTVNASQPNTEAALREESRVPEPEEPIISQGALTAPPLQPRHHKSQPQLKQQQPTLRRTQSRQLERPQQPEIVRPSHEVLEPVIVDDIPLPHSDQSLDSYDALDVAHYESLIESVICEEPQVDLAARLPEISEESAVVPVNFRDGPTPGLSEPEEYWEGEDEEYDDQGYTTAHSIPSRDVTTSGVTTVLQPKATERVLHELEEARLTVEATRLQEDVEEEYWDVSMVAEYSEEIFEYLREMEVKMLPNPHYMETQSEIQWSMRSVLMEWLVQVHSRFQLLPETLFLTVNYVDRFLSYKVVSIGKLQLVGATAILVASKYEEINCPSLQEIVYMVDGGYTADEILKAERFMLSMLGFELGWPGPMSFLRRVSKADDYDLDTRTLAKYFLELTIMDERFVASPPSFLAAGAHCLSRLILNKGPWTQHHVHYSGYTWSQLKTLVAMMLECCQNPEEHHQVIFDKYADKKFKHASQVVQGALDVGFTLSSHQNYNVQASSRPLYC